MEEINKKDLLVMKLIRYFMINKDYVPIIIRGIDGEVWLENPRGEFRIIRIVTKNIYNSEQYEFDDYKIKNITSQIKRQTLNPFIDVLTIYTDVGDNFNKKIDENNSKYKYIILENEKDIEKNDILNKYYKDLKNNMKFKEEGFELLGRITNDINQKNEKDNKKVMNMYNQKKPIVTYILIGINVLMFILMYIFGKGSEDINTLINFGANYSVLTKNGEVFRLLSSAFLHIGIIHLLCNMYSLHILGPTIEHFFGKTKFLIIYLFSAIIGSLFTLVFQSSQAVSAGASGAIFGLLGSLLYFGFSYRGYVGNKIINQIIPVILINLFIGFTMPGISNSAHIGGLIGGLCISYMLGDVDESKSRKINGAVITLILTGFMIYLAFFR